MTKFGIGQPVRRVEDRRFLTGMGSFVSDLILPRQCYGSPVLSPHAHARIVHVEVSAARSAPGVLAVLTGADVESDGLGGIPPYFMPETWGGPKGYATIRPVLVRDRVRCVGDRVAYVVAETETLARDAAELVEVEYEALPAVVGVEEAAKVDAPPIWDDCPTGNIGVTIAFGDKAATNAAFATAKHTIVAAVGKQSHLGQPNRTAMRDRLVQCCRGQVYALHHVAKPTRDTYGAFKVHLRRSGNQNPRYIARRWWWFRHEVQHLSG